MDTKIEMSSKKYVDASSILFLEPILREYIWGGDRLRTEYGYDIPSDHTGECWAISAHPSSDCTVSDGIYKGSTLSSLWKDHRELFGSFESDIFPLLIKIIDAKADLSIQVHPDDEYASAHEGALGKSECWYVLDCDEGATIIIGHHAKDKHELESMIKAGDWKHFLREIPIKKRDFFQIDPGCLHAIKAGTLILETQQNSDITYRVYDYDRLSDGKKRPLHVQQSIDCIKTPYKQRLANQRTEKTLKHATLTHLVDTKYYSVDRIRVLGEYEMKTSKFFTNVSIIDGQGSINGRQIGKGVHFIIPSVYDSVTFDGDMEMIVSYPPSK